jgi:hypothetical protein
MTVSELIKELSKLDQNHKVLLHDTDYQSTCRAYKTGTYFADNNDEFYDTPSGESVEVVVIFGG